MNPKPRYVFDSSTIISAVLFEQSIAAKALEAAFEHGEVLFSQATFKELSEVLGRAKFDKYVTRPDRERFLILLLKKAMVTPIVERIQVCRDSKDDMFLELAVSGAATCLVTSDQDLRVLHPFRSIPIIGPAEFLASIGSENPKGG